MNKPLTIDKFSAMDAQGGMYYLEGFGVKNYNGIPVLEDLYTVSSLRDTGDSAWSTLGTIIGACSFLKGTALAQSAFFIDNNDQIFFDSATDYNGIIHTIVNTDNPPQKPDILFTKDGNLLYVSGTLALGYGYVGRQNTTNTAKIVDGAGRNWETIGIDTADNNKNKVTNLRTGVEYTITSITTTDATKDTLNFTASAGNTNTVNDDFIVWFDNKITLTAVEIKKSIDNENWAKNIELYGDIYWILNGNYLAQLGSDESTIDASYKQLPYRNIGMSMAINGSKMLVSSSEDGNGKLLLWDGYSDGWNNILSTDIVVECVYAYKTGWVFVINNTLYFTDGYQIQKLSTYPDVSPNTFTYQLTAPFNGIASVNDKIFVVSTDYNANRIISGLAIFDPQSGWSVVPAMYGDKLQHNATMGSVFAFPAYAGRNILFSKSGGLISLDNYQSTLPVGYTKSFIYLLNLQEPVNVTTVELNISPILAQNLTATSARQASITVSIGDSHQGIFTKGIVKDAGTPTTTTFVFDDTAYLGLEIGDELQMVGAQANAGERTFVDTITGEAGTRTITCSPALSSAFVKTQEFKITKVKKSDIKTIDFNKLNEPIKFDVSGHYSNKCFVEVTINGIANNFPVSILGIKLN